MLIFKNCALVLVQSCPQRVHRFIGRRTHTLILHCNTDSAGVPRKTRTSQQYQEKLPTGQSTWKKIKRSDRENRKASPQSIYQGQSSSQFMYSGYKIFSRKSPSQLRTYKRFLNAAQKCFILSLSPRFLEILPNIPLFQLLPSSSFGLRLSGQMRSISQLLKSGV